MVNSYDKHHLQIYSRETFKHWNLTNSTKLGETIISIRDASGHKQFCRECLKIDSCISYAIEVYCRELQKVNQIAGKLACLSMWDLYIHTVWIWYTCDITHVLYSTMKKYNFYVNLWMSLTTSLEISEPNLGISCITNGLPQGKIYSAREPNNLWYDLLLPCYILSCELWTK